MGVEGEGHEFGPEEEPGEPTAEEIIEACRAHLDEDAMAGFEGLEDVGDVLGYAFGALIEAGEDPDGILAAAGIILPEGSETEEEQTGKEDESV